MFAVYLTTYRGNKLPPFYIGSTSMSAIAAGYRGSVKSKEYKSIWASEISKNPHLFSTKTIAVYETRKTALECEQRLQIALNVIKSPMYINRSIAAPNGFFGRSVESELNPFFGKKHTKESIIKMKSSKEGQLNPMFGKTGDDCPNGRLFGAANGFYGKKHSIASREKCGAHRRTSKAWEHETELYNLWLSSGRPSIHKFVKLAKQSGYPDCSYKGVYASFLRTCALTETKI